MTQSRELSMSRRGFLQKGVAGTALLAGVLTAPSLVARAWGTGPVRFEPPPLPFAEDALEPHISARTIRFHYGKHHQGYINKLNRIIKGTETAKNPLVDIVVMSAKDDKHQALFNNAAQAWNHDFYWKSLSPKAQVAPGRELEKKIMEDFGSLGKCKQALIDMAAGQFGSGWGWLVLDGNTLKVMKTANADTPIAHGLTPLLTVDVWEHAYYLDYQNQRKQYLKTVVNKLLNWEFAEENYHQAMKS